MSITNHGNGFKLNKKLNTNIEYNEFLYLKILLNAERLSEKSSTGNYVISSESNSIQIEI
jgi:hypothetical protein